MDVSTVCWICLKQDIIPLERKINVFNMYKSLTNIEIKPEDNCQFCEMCIRRIEDTFMFVSKAIKVNGLLRNVQKQQNIPTDLDIALLNNVINNEDTNLDDKNLSLELEKRNEVYINEDISENSVSVSINNAGLFLDETQDTSRVTEYYEYNNGITQNKNSTEKHLCDSRNNENACIQERRSDTLELSEDIINNEMTQNEKKTQSDIICVECNRTFKSSVWFKKHMNKKHSLNNECDKQFECQICSKRYSLKPWFECHVSSHAAPLACGTCDKRFSCRKLLVSHVKTHDEPRYSCQHCGHKLKTKAVLRAHISCVHKNEKKFLCSVCGVSFAHSGNLAVHMRIHRNEKPFLCECGFRTRTRAGLRRHRLRHAGRRPFTCQHCHKAFYEKGALTRHARTHSGSRPYVCAYCGRALADSWKRKTHLMRHHGFTLEQIPKMSMSGIILE